MRTEDEILTMIENLGYEMVTTNSQGRVVKTRNYLKALFWVLGKEIELD